MQFHDASAALEPQIFVVARNSGRKICCLFLKSYELTSKLFLKYSNVKPHMNLTRMLESSTIAC